MGRAGICFVTDEKGKKITVQIDLKNAGSSGRIFTTPWSLNSVPVSQGSLVNLSKDVCARPENLMREPHHHLRPLRTKRT